MINKEVVVFQIEDMLSNINKENVLSFGGYIDNGAAFLELMTNVLTLLKEQEARVLTLDEAVDGTQVYYVEFQYHLDRGWVKCDFDRIYVDGEVAMLFLRNKTFYQQREDYGQLWRLWDKRPTEEQMKAVKWGQLDGGGKS